VIRIVLADDHELLRRSLAALISAEADLDVVGEAGNGLDAVELAHRLRPDVVVMDIRMPGLDGLEATRRICHDETTTTTKVLVLSMFDLDDYVYNALRAGASGFLLKDATPIELLDAVRRIADGESLLAPSLLRRLIDHYLSTPVDRALVPVVRALTAREQEVLMLIARGLSNTELAVRLVVSPATVKTHVAHLLTKLAARDRAQLVIAAYEMGLVTSPNNPTT
jgi:DNA-binding NarL/FixJ family response regulator